MTTFTIENVKEILITLDSSIDWKTRRTSDKKGFYIYPGRGSLGAFFSFNELHARESFHHLEQTLRCLFDFNFTMDNQHGGNYELI